MVVGIVCGLVVVVVVVVGLSVPLLVVFSAIHRLHRPSNNRFCDKKLHWETLGPVNAFLERMIAGQHII